MNKHRMKPRQTARCSMCGAVGFAMQTAYWTACLACVETAVDVVHDRLAGAIVREISVANAVETTK